MRQRDQGAEEQRRRMIRAKLERSLDRSTGLLATGFPALDAALEGGLPRGRIVEISGHAASGKSTLALRIAAEMQRAGCTAVWLDAERTFDPSYAASLGVELERMPVMCPETSESAMSMLQQLARSQAVDLAIVDSAAALVPALELAAGIGEQSPGLQSRVLASGLRALARLAKNAGLTVVFLNQVRTRRGRGGEEEETSAGGASLKLYAAVRIAIESSGARVRFRILKNRVATPFATGEFRLQPAPDRLESP